jgi:hypothetical protein
VNTTLFLLFPDYLESYANGAYSPGKVTHAQVEG